MINDDNITIYHSHRINYWLSIIGVWIFYVAAYLWIVREEEYIWVSLAVS